MWVCAHGLAAQRAMWSVLVVSIVAWLPFLLVLWWPMRRGAKARRVRVVRGGRSCREGGGEYGRGRVPGDAQGVPQFCVRGGVVVGISRVRMVCFAVLHELYS